MVQFAFIKSVCVVSTSPSTWAKPGKFPVSRVLSVLIFPLPYGYDTVSHPLRACMPRSWRHLTLNQNRLH